jgi:CheY-like chemotaxis protein
VRVPGKEYPEGPLPVLFPIYKPFFLLPFPSGQRCALHNDMNDRTVLNGIQVLVIEDEKDTRDLLRYLLELHGAKVIPTDNVIEALEIFAKDQLDVVLTDIGMPEYNGYAFIAAVRKRKSPLQKIPVIALTAFSTPADRDTALISGFDEYLSKPFEPEELIGTIKRLYDEHRINTAA